jgi:hypothetical protein
VKQTLQDMQVKYDEPISMLCDNIDTINISNSPVMQSKMKHILIKYQFLWEHTTKRNIKLEYVGKKEQTTDIFTKPIAILSMYDRKLE